MNYDFLVDFKEIKYRIYDNIEAVMELIATHQKYKKIISDEEVNSITSIILLNELAYKISSVSKHTDKIAEQYNKMYKKIF